MNISRYICWYVLEVPNDCVGVYYTPTCAIQLSGRKGLKRNWSAMNVVVIGTITVRLNRSRKPSPLCAFSNRKQVDNQQGVSDASSHYPPPSSEIY